MGRQTRLPHDEMRKYYLEGHTRKEVAERFGTSVGYAKQICRGLRTGNQYTNGLYDREANAIHWINERAPGFEYAGNFTGVDGFADIRCKECETVYRKSFVAIRHGKVQCSECASREREKLNNQKEKLKEAEQKSKEREKQYKKIKDKAYQVQIVQCECCGSLFVPKRRGKMYCSYKCCTKANNTRKADVRRKKIQSVYVEDVSLERIYEQANGKCWLCGGQCDWYDYYIDADGNFIAGNNYPSRDHVVPLNKGGKHEYSNIKLAHRICNSKKSDRFIPLVV